MGLSNELCCEAGSFSHCHLNPPRCPQPEVLRLYFPVLEPSVAQSVSLPSCSSWFIHTQMWDCLVHHPRPHLLWSSSCCLATNPLCPCCPGLDECFFFNSLVVGLPYSLIFWHLWLFFVFKFVVLLLVVRGSKVFLPMPPPWLEVPEFCFLNCLLLLHKRE